MSMKLESCVIDGFGLGSSMKSLACAKEDGLASVLEFVKVIAGLTDAQASAMQALVHLVRDQGRLSEVESSQGGSGSSDGVVSEPEPRSEVSFGSSASTARARRRARARARKAAEAAKAVSAVSYTARGEGVRLAEDYCYAGLVREDERGKVMAALGPRPTFRKVLDLDAALLRPGWDRMFVSGSEGIFHLSSTGQVSSSVCMHTVAVRSKTWAPRSIGALAASMRVDVAPVYYEKAPFLHDVLAGSRTSKVDEWDVVAESESAFRSVLRESGKFGVLKGKCQARHFDVGKAMMMVFLQDEEVVGYLPVYDFDGADCKVFARSLMSTRPDVGMAMVLLRRPVFVDPMWFTPPASIPLLEVLKASYHTIRDSNTNDQAIKRAEELSEVSVMMWSSRWSSYYSKKMCGK